MMRCDNCGGKHKRIPVERPWYSARFCDKCSIRHSAKEVGRPLDKSAYGKLLISTVNGMGVIGMTFVCLSVRPSVTLSCLLNIS